MNIVENNIGYKQCGRGLFEKPIYISMHKSMQQIRFLNLEKMDCFNKSKNILFLA